jgi:uncharacterized iron-regulated membrane protein
MPRHIRADYPLPRRVFSEHVVSGFCEGVARDPAFGIIRLRRRLTRSEGLGGHVILEEGVAPSASIREPFTVLNHKVDVFLSACHGCWIGLTTGLLLFVICWSGTIAVFSEEIDWLLNPAERVEHRGELRSFGAWADAVARTYPDLRIDSIVAPRTSTSAAEVLVETPDGRLLRTYVNPYTATVTGQTSYFNVQRFFRSLHMSLFDPGAEGIGYYVVMSFSLALVGSLATSLLFYKRWWRRFLAWRAHPNRRAFWSDTHKLMGLWSLWFVALMAVTGLWYLIEFPGWGFAYPELEPVPQTSTRPFLSTDALVARAQQVAPMLRITQMYTPSGYYGPVAVFDGEDEAALVRDRANVVVLDAASGTALLVRPATMLALACPMGGHGRPTAFRQLRRTCH